MNFIKIALAVAFVYLFACNAQEQVSEFDQAKNIDSGLQKPNILLIVADDLGYSDIGPYGSEIKTPRLDELAASGMLLTNFHVNTTCSPTRSMLMSGADAHQVGYGTMVGLETPEQLGQPGYEMYLNNRVAALPELLQDAGYRTYMAGKWDQGGRNGLGKAPHQRGFDRSFALLEGLADHFRAEGVYPILSPVSYLEDGKPVVLPKDFYSSRTYADKIIEYIDSDRSEGEPFFAFLSFTAPHYPLQSLAEDFDQYDGVYDTGYQTIRSNRVARQQALGIVGSDWEIPEIHSSWPRWEELSDPLKLMEVRRMQGYAGMITGMDRNIGRVLQHLESTGLRKNTLVIFMSDNGPDQSNPMDTGAIVSDDYQAWLQERYSLDSSQIGRKRSFTWYGPSWASVSATPFRFHKHFMTRGGVNVPFIASLPGVVEPGVRTDAFVTVMDLLPTFLELARTPHPGADYKGNAVVEPLGKSMLSMLQGKTSRVHDADYVFAMEIFDRRMLQKGEWKITWANPPWNKDKAWSLFNLASDPTEMHDLAKQAPNKLREMVSEWDAYVKRVGVVANEGFVLPIGAGQSHYEWIAPDLR